MRGKLPWPVLGRVTARYQEQQSSSAPGVRWNGVMIEAPRGAKVRAPYFGRVVYADWLQGLGLLLIIGHSGGYMTLYGHAEVLYKSVGDWVAPGDVIAALSDGVAAPQLYFRNSRRAQNGGSQGVAQDQSVTAGWRRVVAARMLRSSMVKKTRHFRWPALGAAAALSLGLAACSAGRQAGAKARSALG